MKDHKGLPVRVSLRAKAITFISLLVLAVGASISWYFLHHSRRVLMEELQKRGMLLAKSLAHNSRYSILIEDETNLQELIKGIQQEEGVLAVRIVNARGTVLAQSMAPGKNGPLGQDARDARRFDAVPIASWAEAPAIHYHAMGGHGVYDAIAPVVAQEAPLRGRERRLDSEIALIGGTPPAPVATPPARLGHVRILLSDQHVRSNIRKTLMAGTGLTAGIVLIGVVGAFAFLAYTLTPVQAMARVASEIAAGDLTQRVASTSHDEIGVLAMTFNRMAMSLEQRLSELSALQAIGGVINSTLALERLMDGVLEAIVRRFHYDRAWLLLVDDATQTLRHGRIAGAPDDRRDRLHEIVIPLRHDSGFHARVALNAEPVRVDDVDAVKTQAYRPLVEQLGVRSFLAVPLKVEDRVLGVLAVAHHQNERPYTTSDEHVLTTLANQFAIGIANALSYREVEQLNAGLEARVRERTEALQRQQTQLREVNLQLEIANRHKSEFLANMSHELRTPLNAIIGFSDVLLERMFGELNDRQAEYLDDILDSGHYLLSLINDILDLSRVEAGQFELELQPFSLREVLNHSLVMIRERALAHRIELTLEIDDAIDTYCGDERKMKQILFNLLSNAVKFTPDGGQVGIQARIVGAMVQITVWDTGIGIAQNDQARIFEAFQQVAQGLSGHTEGTGLGLALTKKFVEMHGGAVWVESAPGQGSTFTVRLPGGR